MAKPRFFKLEVTPTPRLRDGFSLDTLVLEQEMKRNNGGVNLTRVTKDTPIDEKLCRRFVPFFECEDQDVIRALTSRYGEIDSPCAMIVNSEEELATHLSTAYQVAHFHYILGKKHNLKGSFPDLCCGRSSRSLMLSLMDFGYPNATYAYSNRYDHGYTLLPFVLGDKKISGSILIDPTHDQLWDKTDIRNAVMLKLGPKWEYRNGWAHGADLFPDRICTIDIIRKIPNNISDDDLYHRDGEKSLNQAFANPVKVEQIDATKRKTSRTTGRKTRGSL